MDRSAGLKVAAALALLARSAKGAAAAGSSDSGGGGGAQAAPAGPRVEVVDTLEAADLVRAGAAQLCVCAQAVVCCVLQAATTNLHAPRPVPPPRRWWPRAVG